MNISGTASPKSPGSCRANYEAWPLDPFSPAGKRGAAKGDPTMKSHKGYF